MVVSIYKKYRGGDEVNVGRFSGSQEQTLKKSVITATYAMFGTGEPTPLSLCNSIVFIRLSEMSQYELKPATEEGGQAPGRVLSHYRDSSMVAWLVSIMLFIGACHAILWPG